MDYLLKTILESITILIIIAILYLIGEIEK